MDDNFWNPEDRQRNRGISAFDCVGADFHNSVIAEFVQSELARAVERLSAAEEDDLAARLRAVEIIQRISARVAAISERGKMDGPGRRDGRLSAKEELRRRLYRIVDVLEREGQHRDASGDRR